MSKRTLAARKPLAVLIAIFIALAVASGASARVYPELSTSLTQGETNVWNSSASDIDRSAETPDTKLGDHSDLGVDMKFKYGATGLNGGTGTEDPETYPPDVDFRETVKNLVVEIPPGLVGNPNAIPQSERCEPLVFETGECPESATVGEIWIEFSLMFQSSGQPPSALGIIPTGPARRDTYDSPTSGYTRVSLLKTDPEVPARIGVYVRGPVHIGIVHTILEITPVTNEDLRLRTVTINDNPSRVYNENTDEMEDIRIERMFIKLFGKLANGRNFMTNPTSCQPWTSKAWARAHYGNENYDSDPLGTGAPSFVAMNTSTITPDCSNAGAVPFTTKGKVSISTPARDVSPDFDFTITNPGIQGDGQASTSPKKIVTTIPAALNVDVQQLARNCLVADFNADKCPASSRVGNVKIETPLISAGLTGDVYLVKKESGLPDLGLRVRGAITFTQRGSNKYVGAKFNQIETTFDNIPQVGFSKLTFHLDGGPTGLLRSLACPTLNKAPALSNFSYTITAWTGATSTAGEPLNMKNCFGIQQLKSNRCAYKELSIRPAYASRVRVKKVELRIDKKKVATAKPGKTKKSKKLFFRVKVNKYKAGWHKFELRAVYDDGTISKKQAKFKRCL